MMIFDCQAVIEGKPDPECFQSLEYAATYNCVNTDGRFFAIGSRFSYYTGDYTFNYISVDPVEVMATKGAKGVSETMPGTVREDLMKIQMPYGIYVNPYTGYIYATDAGEFVAAGGLYQWTPEGEFLGTHQVYINPAHFLALNPNRGAIGEIAAEEESLSDATIYNLQGMRVVNPVAGQIYIQNGRKFIYHQN